MKTTRQWLRSAWIAALCMVAGSALAADYPTPKEADWTASNFKFHTGEVMPALRLHYTTIGNPDGEPVLVLHGTGQSGQAMLSPGFAGELFGPGQTLDAAKYYIILPDAIGAGKTTKPSDGLRAEFPHYDYTDMVQAQYLLLTQGLHIHHLRLVIGNSMGGMQTWMWGEAHPAFMDALVPMASQPTAMASRNWMTRRMLVESIKRDPTYDNGNYTTQPTALRTASVFMGIATIGGTLAYQSLAPTAERADKLVDQRLAAPPPKDANDYIYQWGSSRDYDAAPNLDRIEAAVLAINAADDERNPPETGVMMQAMTHLKNGHLLLIPASTETRGHGTTGMAKFWQQQLRDFLANVPPKAG